MHLCQYAYNDHKGGAAEGHPGPPEKIKRITNKSVKIMYFSQKSRKNAKCSFSDSKSHFPAPKSRFRTQKSCFRFIFWGLGRKAPSREVKGGLSLSESPNAPKACTPIFIQIYYIVISFTLLFFVVCFCLFFKVRV